MKTKTILSSFVVALTASLAMAEDPEDKTLPTVEEIEEVWNAQCVLSGGSSRCLSLIMVKQPCTRKRSMNS